LDKCYDSAAVTELVEKGYGYMAHIRSCGEDKHAVKQTPREKPRRCVVERGNKGSIDFDSSLCDGKRELKITPQYFILHALTSLSAD
jgi:hypothetical protein